MTRTRRDAERLEAIRAVFQKYPMIPALKQASRTGASIREWTRVRPPLVELAAVQSMGLIADLGEHGFSMPGLEPRKG